MKQRVANYTVVIEKQERTGTNKECFAAYVPVLGVATEADTFDQAQKDIKSLVEFHLQSLAEEGEQIPTEIQFSPVVTSFEARLPENAQIAS